MKSNKYLKNRSQSTSELFSPLAVLRDKLTKPKIYRCVSIHHEIVHSYIRAICSVFIFSTLVSFCQF